MRKTTGIVAILAIGFLAGCSRVNNIGMKTWIAAFSTGDSALVPDNTSLAFARPDSVVMVYERAKQDGFGNMVDTLAWNHANVGDACESKAGVVKLISTEEDSHYIVEYHSAAVRPVLTKEYYGLCQDQSVVVMTKDEFKELYYGDATEAMYEKQHIAGLASGTSQQ